MSNIVGRINAAYERDQNSGKIARTADELPLSYESITSEWLEAVLCDKVPGAKVTGFALGPVDVGSSNRRKISVEYNDAGNAAQLPTKIFCKASHDLLNRLVLGTSSAAHSEVTFYNDILPNAEIQTPECFFAAYDPESFNSIIVLGDLSEEVETFCTHETPINLARAKSQMEVLAQFHSRFYRNEGRAEELKNLRTWQQFFETMHTQMGLEEGAKKGFLEAKEVIPPRLYARADKIWPATVASVATHDSLPTTLIHSDDHLKNWYVLPNDKVGLGDWQCCVVGHWCRDLAYTISTALKIEDRRQWEKELIRHYLDEMAKSGVDDIGFDQAWDLYRQQLFSALAWWTITLCPAEGMPDMQPRDITLDFIGRITTAIDDLDALGTFQVYQKA